MHFPSSRRRRAVPVVRQSSGNPGENIPPKPVRRSISLPRGTSSGWEVGAAPSKGGGPSLDSSRISYFRSLESGKHEADATLPWVLHTFTHRWVKWPEIWGGRRGGVGLHSLTGRRSESISPSAQLRSELILIFSSKYTQWNLLDGFLRGELGFSQSERGRGVDRRRSRWVLGGGGCACALVNVNFFCLFFFLNNDLESAESRRSYHTSYQINIDASCFLLLAPSPPRSSSVRWGGDVLSWICSPLSSP